MSFPRFVSSIALSFVLLGCTTTTPTFTSVEEEAAGGTVYLYRERKTYQSLARIPVFIDSKVAAKIMNGRYTSWRLPPGEHLLELKTDKWPHPSSSSVAVDLDIEDGKEYFFKAGFRPSGIAYTGIPGMLILPTTKAYLEAVAEPQAKKEMDSLKSNDYEYPE